MNVGFVKYSTFFLVILLFSYMIFMRDNDLVTLSEKELKYTDALLMLENMSKSKRTSYWNIQQRADIYFLMGDYEESLKQYSRLVKYRPDDLRNLKKLAMNYETLQMLGDAAKIHEQIIDHHPDEVEYMKKLEEYYDINQMIEQQIDVLVSLCRQKPDEIKYWRKLADLYSRTNNPRAAIDVLDRTMVLFPNDILTAKTLADILIFIGDDKSLVRLSKRLAANSCHKKSIMVICIHFFDRKKYKTSLDIVKLSLRTIPDDPDLLFFAGKILLARGDRESLVFLEEALDNAKYDKRIVDACASSLVLNHRNREAEELIDRTYRNYPDYAVMLKKARVYADASDSGNSIRWLDKCFAAHPHNRHVSLVLVQSAYELKEYRKAITYGNAALKRSPADHLVWQYVIDSHKVLSDKKGLLDALIHYCREFPDDIPMLSELADAYSWNSLYTQSAEIYSRLVTLFPDNTEYRVKYAESLLSAADYERAASAVFPLVQSFPDESEYFDLLVSAATALYPDEKSLVYFRYLFRRGSRSVPISLMYADLLIRSGKLVEAGKVLTAIPRVGKADVQGLLDISYSFYEKGYNDLAEACLHKASEAAPHDTRILIVRASRAFASGNYDLSISMYEEAGRRTRLNEEDTYGMCEAIAAKNGHSAKSVQCFRRYIEIYGESAGSTPLGMRKNAHAHWAAGDRKRAEAIIRRAVSLFPGNIDIVNDYAEMLIDMKEYGKAGALLEGKKI